MMARRNSAGMLVFEETLLRALLIASVSLSWLLGTFHAAHEELMSCWLADLGAVSA
jgi:hypothetical protein